MDTSNWDEIIPDLELKINYAEINKLFSYLYIFVQNLSKSDSYTRSLFAEFKLRMLNLMVASNLNTLRNIFTNIEDTKLRQEAYKIVNEITNLLKENKFDFEPYTEKEIELSVKQLIEFLFSKEN